MSGVDVLAALKRRIDEGDAGLIDVADAVAELIEAIKPLAALDLRPGGFDKRDDSQPVYARDNTVITVGDVRRAAAALARCRGGAE